MNLLILGAGQYGMVAKEIAESMNCFSKISFLDDNNPIAIGRIADCEKFIGEYDAAIVAIGNVSVRLELLEKLRLIGYKMINLIHPSSYVSSSAKIGYGCIVEPLAGIHTSVEIGNGCLVSMMAAINHNAIIGEGCHIDCHSTVTARAVVSNGVKVMSGMVYHCT